MDKYCIDKKSMKIMNDFIKQYNQSYDENQFEATGEEPNHEDSKNFEVVVDNSENAALGLSSTCWVDSYQTHKPNVWGMIFVIPTINPKTILVSLNQSRKQIRVVGKQLKEEIYNKINFPFKDLHHEINSRDGERFIRNKISFKIEGSFLIVEFETEKDLQFNQVKNNNTFVQSKSKNKSKSKSKNKNLKIDQELPAKRELFEKREDKNNEKEKMLDDQLSNYFEKSKEKKENYDENGHRNFGGCPHGNTQECYFCEKDN